MIVIYSFTKKYIFVSDPFFIGKKKVTGMDAYKQYYGIVNMQKSEFPAGQQSTKTGSQSGNYSHRRVIPTVRSRLAVCVKCNHTFTTDEETSQKAQLLHCAKCKSILICYKYSIIQKSECPV